MRKRTIPLVALAALALGVAGWRLAGPTFAQDGAGQDDGPRIADEQRSVGQVIITVAAGDDELPGPDVLGGPIRPDLLDLAAKALGISRAQLLEEQKAGRSLDEIARAHGTTKQAVVDGIMAGMRAGFAANLDQAVAEGKISRARADKLLGAFKIEITLDDLPRGDALVDGAPRIHRGLFGFFKGDGSAEGETLTLPVPPLGLGEEDVLIPSLPGRKGEEPHIVALAGRGGLDQATFDKVKGVLQAAVGAGRLTQVEADQALEQLDPARRPAIKVLRWDDTTDETPDEESGSDGAKARRGGAKAPARRSLVEPL